MAADVVVVGGGILGCAVALHLTRAGAGGVTLVESDEIASGTTVAGAGFVGLFAAGYANFWDEHELALERYGLDFYGELAGGADIGYSRNGNMWLAASEVGWAAHVEPMTRHPLAPARARALTPHEVAALTDVVDAGAVVAGFLHPDGIQVDTAMATRAIAAEAERKGAVIRPHTEVVDLLIGRGSVRGVRTSDGDIAAGAVVIAAGAWSNQLMRATGWSLPLLPSVVSRVIAEATAAPATMPTLMVPELTGLWIREFRGVITYGSGLGNRPVHELNLDGIPHRPECGDVVTTMTSAHAGDITRLIPALAGDRGSTWIQGVPCFTPDRRFLAGPVPGVEGLFVVAGDNEAGATHGPGLGRLVADIVTTGSSELVDPARYRLDRFTAGQFPTPAAVAAAMPPRR
jgi:glycine/D-amino acid oxidase-like deaminating enzyme